MDDAAYALVDDATPTAARADAASETRTLLKLASPIVANQMIGFFIPRCIDLLLRRVISGSR